MGDKEKAVWDVCESPELARRTRQQNAPVERMPERAAPVSRLDMGWQYLYGSWCSRLCGAGVRQDIGGKESHLDSAATEQASEHLKDEFFCGHDWEAFESFKAELDARCGALIAR